MENKIQLTKEKETLFITLCARALDYRSKKSILNDSTANSIVEKVGINISKYASSRNKLNMVRAKQFDEWTKNFITQNKNAVVVYLGCGLGSRVTRIQPSPQIIWFDIDYAEVIDFRKNFYDEKNNYTMIGSSITAQDWLKKIPADKPALIIAEGVLEYLPEEDVKILFNGLTNYFFHGEIIFDVINSFAIKFGKKKLNKITGAVHLWAVDDISEVEKLNSKLKRKDAVPIFKSVFIKKLPFAFRFLSVLANLSTKYKNIIQLLRYEF